MTFIQDMLITCGISVKKGMSYMMLASIVTVMIPKRKKKTAMKETECRSLSQSGKKGRLFCPGWI